MILLIFSYDYFLGSRSSDNNLSTAWVGGKLEKFKNIGRMIGQWEDMERVEEERRGGGDTNYGRAEGGDLVRG